MVLKLMLFLYIVAIIFYKGLKKRNYENEATNNTLLLLLFAFIPVFLFDELKELDNLYIYLFIILFSIIVINITPRVLKKQTYSYSVFNNDNKGHYINEIKEIIKKYSTHLDVKSEIKLDEQRIIFKNVSKEYINGCLSSVDKVIECQKEKFDSKKIFLKDISKVLLFIVLGIIASLLIRLLLTN